MSEHQLLETLATMKGTKSLRMGIEELEARHGELEAALSQAKSDEDRELVRQVLHDNMERMRKLAEGEEESESDPEEEEDSSDSDSDNEDEEGDIPSATPAVDQIKEQEREVMAQYEESLQQEGWGDLVDQEDACVVKAISEVDDCWREYQEERAHEPREKKKQGKSFRLEETGAIPKAKREERMEVISPDVYLKAKSVPPMDHGRLREILKGCPIEYWDPLIEAYAAGRDSRRDEDLREAVGGLRKVMVGIEKLLNSYKNTLANAAAYQDQMKVFLDKTVKDVTKQKVQQGVTGEELKNLQKPSSIRQFYTNGFFGLYRSPTGKWEFTTFKAIKHPGFKDFADMVLHNEEKIKQLLAFDWRSVAASKWRAQSREARKLILKQLGKPAEPWYKFLTPLGK